MLNKTPGNSRAKTVWARKKYLLVIPLFVLLAGVVWYVLTSYVVSPGSEQSCQTNPALETRSIWGNDWAVEVEVAETGEQKVRGLSGRNCLGYAKGMLFTYDLSGDYCYWMKDMNFAIDMVWIDDEQKVVTIREGVAPNTYPQSFCPDRPARYVLEVDAGFARQAGWRVGTQFELGVSAL